MPSTIQVKNWYAQSFQELTELHKPKISDELAKLLSKGASKHSLPEDSINENLIPSKRFIVYRPARR